MNLGETSCGESAVGSIATTAFTLNSNLPSALDLA